MLLPAPRLLWLAAALLATTWTVRIEADTKNAQGQMVHVSADGKLADIASYHRTLTGTWTQGTTRGDFKLTRN